MCEFELIKMTIYEVHIPIQSKIIVEVDTKETDYDKILNVAIDVAVEEYTDFEWVVNVDGVFNIMDGE